MYQPSQKILEKYADVLVNFALGGGGGIKKGETVRLTVYDIAKPFYTELRRAILLWVLLTSVKELIQEQPELHFLRC